MREVFIAALSLSLSGAAMIVAVLLICRLLKNKVSNRWRYYIWVLVVLRLLVPFSPQSSVIGTLFGGNAEPSAMEVPLSSPMVSPSITNMDISDSPDMNPGLAQGSESQAKPDGVIRPQRTLPTASASVKATLLSIASWLWIPWVLVMLILFIRKITLYQSFAKYVRAGQSDVTDEDLLMEFGAICAQRGIKRVIELRVNPLVASPLLLGILRPCIVLPTTDISTEERQYIYLHELTHYQCGDIFYKWLLQLTLCIHWFNPLVHIMVREVNRLCELSCDEAVIRSMGSDERRGYGHALLNSLEAPGTYRESLAAVTLHENSVLLKERLESIKEYGKHNKWRILISIILCLVVFIGGFALGAYIPQEPISSHPNGGELTPEGLPIMSASNRNIYEAYVSPLAITGILWQNFSPEDISALVENDGVRLLTILHALERETVELVAFSENDDSGLPADFVVDTLCSKLPLYPEQVQAALANVYDTETNTYRYSGGLGGGPALPIVTGFQHDGKLLSIWYTWYVGDPGGDEFRYSSDDSGELMIVLSGDNFRYLSNKVIEAPKTAKENSGAEYMATPEEYSEYTYYARTLMPQAHTVFTWYYSDAPYDDLWIDFDSPSLELNGSHYKKVVRFGSMDELKAATEAVFTIEFCEENFYSLFEIGKFREIDGVLYVGDQGGISEGHTTPPKEYILLSVEDDRVVLTAICEGLDPNVDNPSYVPLIDYSFELVLLKTTQKTIDMSPIDCWRVDSYYSYDADGFRGDLQPYEN